MTARGAARGDARLDVTRRWSKAQPPPHVRDVRF